MQYRVTAYVNVGRSVFRDFMPGDPIALVDAYNIKADSVRQATDGQYGSMWVVGNRMGCDINGKEWPSDVRSMSVSDVIKVVTPSCYAAPDGKITWLACKSVGWAEIPEPTRIVPIAGTAATSREA